MKVRIKWLLILTGVYISIYSIGWVRAVYSVCYSKDKTSSDVIDCSSLPLIWEQFFSLTIRNGFMHFICFVGTIFLTGMGYQFFSLAWTNND